MQWMLRYQKWILGALGLLTVFFILGIGRLKVSFSFEDFYAQHDPEAAYYKLYQQRFSEDQNYLFYIALKSEKGQIFDQDFLQQADSLFAHLTTLPNVDSSLIATRFEQRRRVGMSVRSRPYFQFDSEEAVSRTREKFQRDSSLYGIFITRDTQYICSYFFINPVVFDTKERDVLSEKIAAQLEASGMEYVISGIPFIRTRYIAKIGQELALFVSLATLLIVLVQYLTYRNFWGVLLPQIVVITSMIWLLGIMGWVGQTINLINNLLIPILFVVGMSDVIHLTTKYLQEIRKGWSRSTAMKITLREIGLSIFLTSITTAIGFASLMVSRIPPIRDFGLFAALGVLITFLITLMVLPVILLRISPQKFLQVPSLENQPGWNKLMMGLYHLTTKGEKAVALVFAFIIAACSLLIFQIPLDITLIEDIGKKDPIRQSMHFFEENAYGLRPFELGISVQDTSQRVYDREILESLDRMQNFLADEASFSPFLSLPTLVKEAHAFANFNRPRYRRLPDTQAEIDELLTLASSREEASALLDRVMTPDGQHTRLSARLPDLGTLAYQAMMADLDSFVQAELDTTLFSYRSTGHAYLTEHNLRYVRRSLLSGLAIAFVVIGIIMGFLFRSGKMLLVSMVPNVVPLLLTGGLMGLFGITLTASTALVFVIAFGIAVDDTIHFLSRYRLERSLGRTVDEAIRETLLGTGKAMLLTSLILMAGFVLLLLSDFGGTFNTGLFTGLTIIFALLADFLLLPILLRWVDRG